jgi:hypothetical protein
MERAPRKEGQNPPELCKGAFKPNTSFSSFFSTGNSTPTGEDPDEVFRKTNTFPGKSPTMSFSS